MSKRRYAQAGLGRRSIYHCSLPLSGMVSKDPDGNEKNPLQRRQLHHRFQGRPNTRH